MKSASVTFIGGAGAERVNPYKWGGIAFPLDKPVMLDPEKPPAGVDAVFVRHVLDKLQGGGNRFFKVEAIGEKGKTVKPAAVLDADPAVPEEVAAPVAEPEKKTRGPYKPKAHA